MSVGPFSLAEGSRGGSGLAFFRKGVLSLDADGNVEGLLDYTLLPNVDSKTQPSNCKCINCFILNVSQA